MPTVHLPTLILLAAATAAVTAVIFVIIGHPRRLAAPELLLWAGGFALKAAGLALVLARGRVPLVASLLVANLLVIAATQVVLVGLERFAGRPRPVRHVGFLAIAVVVLGVAYPIGYAAASVAISVLIATVMIASVAQVIALGRPGLRTERWVLGVMFGLETALLLVRGVGAAAGHTPVRLAPDPGTVVLYVSLILAPLLIGPALLALVSRREQVEKERVIGELTTALDEVRTLRGLLPICAACKQIRDDAGTWTTVEAYVSSHSHAQFTHSICPGCEARLYPPDA